MNLNLNSVQLLSLNRLPICNLCWVLLPMINLYCDKTSYRYRPSGIFFISVSSLKVFGHSIHSERRRIYQEKSMQALQNDTKLSYHDYSVSGSSSQRCSGTLLKLLRLFSSIFVHSKTFRSSWLLKYLINIELIKLSATEYKSKLLRGLTCHFMLDRLHWCTKQRNRTSVLLGELWYTIVVFRPSPVRNLTIDGNELRRLALR